jgi:hypothetical protein
MLAGPPADGVGVFIGSLRVLSAAAAHWHKPEPGQATDDPRSTRWRPARRSPFARSAGAWPACLGTAYR